MAPHRDTMPGPNGRPLTGPHVWLAELAGTWSVVTMDSSPFANEVGNVRTPAPPENTMPAWPAWIWKFGAVVTGGDPFMALSLAYSPTQVLSTAMSFWVAAAMVPPVLRVGIGVLVGTQAPLESV